MIDFNKAIDVFRRNGGFKPNNQDTSFYRTYTVQGSKPLQVRVSNHGTWLWSWYDKNYNPSSAINYCIVFTEDGNYESNVSVDMNIKDEQGNIIGQRETFEVVQYIYNCNLLDINDALIINQNIQNIWQNKDFKDPFAGTPKRAKVVKLKPNEPIETIVENKQINRNRNMKQTIRLTESKLRGMIQEAVGKVFRQVGLPTTTYHDAFDQMGKESSKEQELDHMERVEAIIEKALTAIRTLNDCVESLHNRRDKRLNSKYYDDLVRKIYNLKPYFDKNSPLVLSYINYTKDRMRQPKRDEYWEPEDWSERNEHGDFDDLY